MVERAGKRAQSPTLPPQPLLLAAVFALCNIVYRCALARTPSGLIFGTNPSGPFVRSYRAAFRVLYLRLRRERLPEHEGPALAPSWLDAATHSIPRAAAPALRGIRIEHFDCRRR